MTGKPWTRKDVALIAAIVMLACIAAVLAIGLAYPEPMPNASLGPDWHCNRIALVFTTCSRVQHADAGPIRVLKVSACPWRRT